MRGGGEEEVRVEKGEGEWEGEGVGGGEAVVGIDGSTNYTATTCQQTVNHQIINHQPGL